MAQSNFITDGRQPHRLSDDMYIPRYGAWSYDYGKQKMQVAECSDDLEYLKEKYNVSSDRIVTLGKEKSK